MPTLVKMEIDVPRLIVKLTEKIVNLRHEKIKDGDFQLFVLSDGFVYYYQGIYAFSNERNKVNELIIADMDKLGLVLIDTKEASRTDKPLIKKMEEFLVILYKVIGDATQESMNNVSLMQDRYITELKEEILLQHAV